MDIMRQSVCLVINPKIVVNMLRKYHNHNCRQTRGIMRKSHTSITRHKGDKQSKATSSLIPIKMIAQSNVQQNIEQIQNPTMGVTINNESPTTEPKRGCLGHNNILPAAKICPLSLNYSHAYQMLLKYITTCI